MVGVPHRLLRLSLPTPSLLGGNTWLSCRHQDRSRTLSLTCMCQGGGPSLALGKALGVHQTPRPRNAHALGGDIISFLYLLPNIYPICGGGQCSERCAGRRPAMRLRIPVCGGAVELEPKEVSGFYVGPAVGRMSLLATHGIQAGNTLDQSAGAMYESIPPHHSNE